MSKTDPVSVRLDEDLRVWLDKQCELDNRTLSGMIVHLLREAKRDDEFEQT